MDQAQIDQIAEKVIERLLEKMIAAAAKKQVLMIFSGAGSGYMAGMRSIRLLSKGGHPLTVVMTASARQVIGEAHVREAGAECVIGDGEWVNVPRLVREVDLLLIPTLSMNTAAHLALGLMDSLITTLTLGALLAGKHVLAVCDGANPYGNGGRVFGESNDHAPILREKLAENLTTLMNFGVQLVKEEDFLLSLVNWLTQAGPEQSPQASTGPKQSNPSKTTAPAVVRISPGAMLTASDLLVYPPGSSLRLGPGARLTPLAQEVVFRQELNLYYEE